MRRILTKFRFGSAHTHHKVELNLQQKWISIKNQQLLCIQGFEEHNYHEHEVDHTNPYQHIVDAPFLSFERFYFQDPYYQNDEQDPLVNEPHGYLFADDPLSDKQNLELPLLELIAIGLFSLMMGIVFGQNRFVSLSKGEIVLHGHITRGLIEDDIRKIRIVNKELEDRLAQLEDEVKK